MNARRIIYVTVALLLAAGLAGCGRPAADEVRVTLVKFTDAQPFDMMQQGLAAQLKQELAGTPYVLEVKSAQGDVGTLNSIMDLLANDGTKVLVTTTTPVLQTAVRKLPQLPTVFTFIDDPVANGVATSDTQHLPNVTGVITYTDFAAIVPVLRAAMPHLRRAGALFCPTDNYSVYAKNELTRVLAAAGMELVTVPVATPQELNDAAAALCGKGIDCICQFPEPMTAGGFPALVQAARRAKLPLFAMASDQAAAGAIVGYGHDFIEVGHAAARLVARIAHGETPAQLAFVRAGNEKLLLNPDAAAATGYTIPPALQALAGN